MKSLPLAIAALCIAALCVTFSLHAFAAPPAKGKDVAVKPGEGTRAIQTAPDPYAALPPYCAEIARGFDRMEHSIAVLYSKLIQQLRADIAATSDANAQKVLSAEIASLEKELASVHTELAKQRAKAIESCLKLDEDQQARLLEQATKLISDLFTVLSEGVRLPPNFQDATSEEAEALTGVDLGDVLGSLGSLASARKPILITRSSRLLDPPSTKKARRFREIVFISLRALKVPIALQPETALTAKQTNFATANQFQIVAKGTEPVPRHPAQ